jgi:hypothetical protein
VWTNKEPLISELQYTWVLLIERNMRNKRKCEKGRKEERYNVTEETKGMPKRKGGRNEVMK